MIAIGPHHHLSQCDHTSLHCNVKITARKHFQVVQPVLHSHAFKLNGIFTRPDHNGEAAIHIGRRTFRQVLKIYSGSYHRVSGLHICDLSMQHRDICSLSGGPGTNTNGLQHSSLSAVNIFLLCRRKSGNILIHR